MGLELYVRLGGEAAASVCRLERHYPVGAWCEVGWDSFEQLPSEEYEAELSMARAEYDAVLGSAVDTLALAMRADRAS